MGKKQQSTREIHFILLVYIVQAILSVGLVLFVFYQMAIMYSIATDIYQHPLKVSSTALTIQSDILKIDRDMKDIILRPSEEELRNLIENINKHERNIYKNITIIEENILGKEGVILAQETRKLFQNWKPMRDEVIALVYSGQNYEVINITKNRDANHVLKLERSTTMLDAYAQNKATGFKYQSDTLFEKLKFTKFFIIFLLLLTFLLIVYYTVNRISKYIDKNEHLKRVLSVIRGVNQLIVREKNPQKLLQYSCDILISNHIYDNVWIAIFDNNKQLDYLVGTDTSENFALFKEKIKSGRLPHCHIFNIELKYGEKVYGYLTLSADKKHIQDNDELALLDEVAGDIAYALNNIEIEESVVYLKELYGNIINSVENLLFVKDSNFNYIACNKAFEKFLGMSKDEIIGKNDYDFFEKEVADLFRKHDEIVITENKPQSSFEWVTYPDGKKVYLLRVKSPLLDSDGKVIGIVENSADFTERKEAEKKLAESYRQMSALMNNLPGMAYRCKHEREWSMEFASEGCFPLTGYQTTELVNNQFIRYIDLIHPDDKEFVLDEIQTSVQSGEYFSLNYRLLTRDEKTKWVWEHGVGIYGNDNELLAIEGVILDYDAHKRAEEMLKEQGKLMIIQSRHAAMGEMISMIAHQWRQPISIISMIANNMLIDIALEDFSPSMAEKYSQDILEQTKYLSKTMDDFRNFFRADKSVTKVKLEDVLNETYSIVKNSLSNHNVKFKIVNKSESEIDAYPRELMQVFVNIINNAKDVLVVHKIEDAFIEVTIYEDENYVNTTICDNGGGIENDILSSIFDPYFTTKDEKSGTGLGLYMSKLIIEDHLHGIIEASNTEKGACFLVRLPKSGDV